MFLPWAMYSSSMARVFPGKKLSEREDGSFLDTGFGAAVTVVRDGQGGELRTDCL